MKKDVLQRGVGVTEKQREEEIRCMAKRGLGEMKITQKTQNKEASRNGERWG